MNEALDPLAIAKHPTQQRAKLRFDRIVAEAEALLIEQGLAGFSIPLLAERLDYTRGSVYAYFPTPYALLNELVQRYLLELESLYAAKAPLLRTLSWSGGIEAVVDIAVAYHNSHPAARLLLLGGAVTDDSFRAQEGTHRRLGQLGRQVFSPDIPLPKSPDVPTLVVDIGIACFRRSFFEHGKITPAYRDAAVAAMTGFLRPYVESATKAGNAKRRPHSMARRVR